MFHAMSILPNAHEWRNVWAHSAAVATVSLPCMRCLSAICVARRRRVRSGLGWLCLHWTRAAFVVGVPWTVQCNNYLHSIYLTIYIAFTSRCILEGVQRWWKVFAKVCIGSVPVAHHFVLGTRAATELVVSVLRGVGFPERIPVDLEGQLI